MAGHLRKAWFGLALVALVLVCLGAATATASSRWGLVYARVVQKGTARYLVLRINEPAPVAKIRVSLVAGKQRIMKRVVRRIRTNRRTRVSNLAIPRSVRTVRVRVLRLID
jgi:hypothetical protein